MWAIYVLILTGLYASPYTMITTERFETKHECESFVEQSIKQFDVDVNDGTYTFTNGSGDIITASCGPIDY